MADHHDSAFRTRLKKHFRMRRMRAFSQMFPLAPDTRVLDIGGTRFNWSLIAARPRITMINIEGETGQFEHVEMARGDATRLDTPDNSFDLVYSNSVIEHVGDWPQMKSFATHVRRLAPRYYVQTPNRWFPVEPHHIGVFLHWFPFPIARRLYRWLTLRGWLKQRSQANIDRLVGEIRLLSRRQLQELFPDGTIIAERTWLFPFVAKSFIVVRGATGPLASAQRQIAPAATRADAAHST